MRIAIAGTRGIPNTYGGFEQCAELLSELLTRKGHQVTVYNTHYHPFRQPELHGVRIVRKFNPEKFIGTAGNFVYDYLCMKHALRTKHDILLVLGYTTASVFFPFMRFGSTRLVTNMDGLEWKRDKWNGVVKKLARWFEKLGAVHSPYLVADNPEIASYLEKEYGRPSRCIAYGCTRFNDPDASVPGQFGVEKQGYGMVVARMEPENNIEMALKGFMETGLDCKLLVVGNTGNAYGRRMKELAENDNRVVFTEGVYDQRKLSSLRYYSAFYIHGHSVGGTNPSLLEAMACGCFILIHDNPFNREVVKGDAPAFGSSDDLTRLLDSRLFLSPARESQRAHHYDLVENSYNWDVIAARYEDYFREILNEQAG